MTGWLLASQARLGRPGEARAALAALDDERASSGEIRNARAVICLADGNPAGALNVLHDVLDGTAPVIAYATVVEARHSTAAGLAALLSRRDHRIAHPCRLALVPCGARQECRAGGP